MLRGPPLKVKLYGFLRSVVGRFEIDKPIRRRMTVLQVVNELLNPQLPDSLICRSGDAASSGLLFVLNGKDVSLLNGLDTVVNDQDELAIIPVSHGG